MVWTKTGFSFTSAGPAAHGCVYQRQRVQSVGAELVHVGRHVLDALGPAHQREVGELEPLYDRVDVTGPVFRRVTGLHHGRPALGAGVHGDDPIAMCGKVIQLRRPDGGAGLPARDEQQCMAGIRSTRMQEVDPD